MTPNGFITKIFTIQINELRLRHVIFGLDGKYIPKQGWTGPLGKLLGTVDSLDINWEFKSFPDLVNIIEIPEVVVKNMSTDQKTATNS